MADSKTQGFTLATLKREFAILCERETTQLIKQAYANFRKDMELLENAPLSLMIADFNQALNKKTIFAASQKLYFQADTNNHLQNNIINLVNIVASKIRPYEKKYHLAYHTLNHALETGQTAALISQLSGYQEWKILLFICGLFHDVIYTRTRVKDEVASADFLINTLKLFLSTQNENKSYFVALIRTIIIGGSLPIFLCKPIKKSKTCKRYQKTFIELNIAYDREEFQSENTKTIFALGHALTTADVQRSLIPAAIANCKANQPHKIINKESALYKIINNYYNSNQLAITKNEFLDIVYTKLGQGIRFVSENINPGQEGLSRLQLAIIKFLHTPTNDQTKIAKTINQHLDQFSNFIQSELNFSDISINSLNHGAPCRNYEFYPESWEWHKAIYAQILQLATTNPEIYAKVILDLLNNAKRQQGLAIQSEVLYKHLKIIHKRLTHKLYRSKKELFNNLDVMNAVLQPG